MSIYREAAHAECSLCRRAPTHHGGDGKPYCDMHEEPEESKLARWAKPKPDHAAQVEAAAWELLERLPRCSDCGALATVNLRVDGRTPSNQGPYYSAWFCDEHRPDYTSESVSFALPADAARRLGALLEGE